MKFHCPNCNAKYRISEDKFASHPNPKLRCKQCATIFSVKAALEAEGLAGGAESIAPGAGRESTRAPESALAPGSFSAADSLLPRAVPLPTPSGLGASEANTVGEAAKGVVAPPRRRPSIPPSARAPFAEPTAAQMHPSVPPAGRLPGPNPVPGSLAPAPQRPSFAPRPALAASPAVRGIAPKPASALKPTLSPKLASLGVAAAAPLAAGVPPSRPAVRSLGSEVATPSPELPVSEVATNQQEIGGPANAALSSAAVSQAPGPVSAASQVLAGAPEFTLEGWYLEHDGTPLGPLTASTLRLRAAAHELTEDTLVWREGVDDWKEASQYPALAGLLAEFRSDAANETSDGRELFNWGSQTGAPAVNVVALPIPEAPAKTPAVALPPPSAAEPSRLSLPGGVISRGFSGAALGVAILVSLGLGFGGGYVVFGRHAAPLITAAQPAAPEAAVGGNWTPPPPPPPPEVVASGKAAPASAGGQARSDKKDAAARKEAASAAQESVEAAAETPEAVPAAAGGGLLAGLGASQAGDGPQAPSPGGAPKSAAAGPSLDARAIQSTVQRNQPSVGRNCWQRALASAVGAPAGARVTVTIKIAPSGAVTDVAHSGEAAGYPGLAGCIATRVKGWSFPASGGPTVASVPFVFAAQ